MKFSEYASYDALGLAILIADGEISALEAATTAREAIEARNPARVAFVESSLLNQPIHPECAAAITRNIAGAVRKLDTNPLTRLPGGTGHPQAALDQKTFPHFDSRDKICNDRLGYHPAMLRG